MTGERNRLVCWLILLCLAGSPVPAHPQETGADMRDLFGTWTGSWEGLGASGGFELVLERGKDGMPKGRVSVTGEPTYSAELKTLSLEDGKLVATYDFPPDDQIEVDLTATFQGKSAAGTWTARQRADRTELASGSWTVMRQ